MTGFNGEDLEAKPLEGGDLDEPLRFFGDDDLSAPVCAGFGSVATARTRLVRFRTVILVGDA